MSESIEVAKIFKHAQYGQLRACVIAEEKYFVGRDVARMFNMKDASKAFRRRVDAGDKIVRAVRTDGQCHTLLLISENGLRSFLGALDTPTARAVAAWLQEEFAAEPVARSMGLVPVEWQQQRILTTAQLAEKYECSVDQIKVNFSRNIDRFVEGKHYFRLEGAALENLRVTDSYLQISPMTRALYLWTARGAARHAKMLGTDRAWEVFEELEENYFNRKRQVLLNAPEEVVKLKKQLKGISKVEFAVVYAFLMGNGSVKIGMTSNLTERAKQLQTETGCEVLQFKSTPFMIKDEAAVRERELLEKFAPYREAGEFFDVKFTLVAAEL